MSAAGLISVASVDGFRATAARLDAALDQRGINPTLRLDHAAAASVVGLHLDPVLLILFGNPKVGTSLMQAKPTAGIDLPLKLLVWQSHDATVWISYNDPAWVAARHDLAPSGEAQRAMATLLGDLAFAASGMVRP